MDGFKQAGGLEGGHSPPGPFANIMIRTAFPYCSHGDDIAFTRSMDGLRKSGAGRLRRESGKRKSVSQEKEA